MSYIEAEDFLKGIPRGNETIWKMLFPWIRKRQKNVIASCGHGNPRIQGELNEDEVIQWVITILNMGHKLSQKRD